MYDRGFIYWFQPKLCAQNQYVQSRLMVVLIIFSSCMFKTLLLLIPQYSLNHLLAIVTRFIYSVLHIVQTKNYFCSGKYLNNFYHHSLARYMTPFLYMYFHTIYSQFLNIIHLDNHHLFGIYSWFVPLHLILENIFYRSLSGEIFSYFICRLVYSDYIIIQLL